MTLKPPRPLRFRYRVLRWIVTAFAVTSKAVQRELRDMELASEGCYLCPDCQYVHLEGQKPCGGKAAPRSQFLS